MPIRNVVGSGDTAAAWGGITGTLANQIDLQAALDAKATIKRPTRPVSSTDEATTADDHIEATGTYTQTLYTMVGNAGRLMFITNAGAGVITVTGKNAETIMGQASWALQPGESLSLIVNTAEDNWVLRG